MLEGSLPAAWAAVPALRVLRLDDNRLNGSLAAAALPGRVQELGLRGNALEGGVPQGIKRVAPELRCVGAREAPADEVVQPAHSSLPAASRSDDHRPWPQQGLQTAFARPRGPS